MAGAEEGRPLLGAGDNAVSVVIESDWNQVSDGRSCYQMTLLSGVVSVSPPERYAVPTLFSV